MRPVNESCPLCGGASTVLLSDDREYRRCGTCALTFVPASQHLTLEAEKARYATHRNSPEDAGYRAFLDKLLAPLAARLPAGARGLDFGCGPGPTASLMMTERGFPCAHWDPHFAPDAESLGKTYGFVTCTEVVEHLRAPAETFAALERLLEPGAYLGVLTSVLEEDAAFPAWWYRRDPTHIAFYRPETLVWIASRYGWELERAGRDAALFRKATIR